MRVSTGCYSVGKPPTAQQQRAPVAASISHVSQQGLRASVGCRSAPGSCSLSAGTNAAIPVPTSFTGASLSAVGCSPRSSNRRPRETQHGPMHAAKRHADNVSQHQSLTVGSAVVTLSPASVMCMREAQRQAQEMGSTAVYPAHVLLGCLHLGEAWAATGGGNEDELYVCRAVARILTEAGITTQEATALLREGMEGLGLPTTAAQGDRVQARAHTFSGQLEVQAVLPGVTQHMLREACLMVADTDQAPCEDQVQPAHLLLALLNMAPLPTVLHNPISWVINKNAKRPGLPYMVISKIHHELETAPNQPHTEWATGTCSTDDSTDPISQAVCEMTLSELAGFLGMTCHAALPLVLSPSARAAVGEQLDDVLAASDSLTASEWLGLLEGAEAQGIQVGLDILRLALPSISSAGSVPSFDMSGDTGGLVFAACRALHSLGHTWDVVDHHGHVPRSVHELMTGAGWGALMATAVRQLLCYITDQDWQSLMRASGTLMALDSVLGARGYFATQGLNALAATHADQHGMQKAAALVAASHLVSYFDTPQKSWACELDKALPLLPHLPTSSSVTIYRASTRGVSTHQDILGMIHLPACSPSQLITLAEVLEQKGGQGPDSKWWTQWRDCMCSLSHAISGPEAARLVAVVAKLQAKHHGLATLLSMPITRITGSSSSTTEGTSRRDGSSTSSSSATTEGTTTPGIDIASLINTGSSLADTICTLVRTHLTSLEGHDRAALLFAATQLVVTAQVPAFSLLLADILQEGTQHNGDDHVSSSEAAAVLASAHAQAFLPLVLPLPPPDQEGEVSLDDS